MNDLRILDDLFKKHNDEIHFELFKRSNIVWIYNENQGDYNKEIIFNTRAFLLKKLENLSPCGKVTVATPISDYWNFARIKEFLIMCKQFMHILQT